MFLERANDIKCTLRLPSSCYTCTNFRSSCYTCTTSPNMTAHLFQTVRVHPYDTCYNTGVCQHCTPFPTLTEQKHISCSCFGSLLCRAVSQLRLLWFVIFHGSFNCIFSKHAAMELYWWKWQVLCNLTENRALELVIVLQGLLIVLLNIKQHFEDIRVISSRIAIIAKRRKWVDSSHVIKTMSCSFPLMWLASIFICKYTRLSSLWTQRPACTTITNSLNNILPTIHMNCHCSSTTIV